VLQARRLAICLTTLAACLTLCASAAAETVTVGSPLTAAFSFQAGTTAVGSWANIALPEPEAHAASPISGTVVRWRVKGAFLGGPFFLQVLRPAGGFSYASVATSAPETPAGEATQVFATDLPIQAGDVIAIETSHASDRIGAAAQAAGVDALNWIPPLVDGGAAAPAHTFEIEDELGFDADVESESPVVAPVPTPTPISTPAPPTSPTTTPQPSTPTCTVPKLIGAELEAAKAKLRAAGCKLGKVTKRKAAGVTTGKVVAQGKKPGTVLAAGTVVKVTLGKGRARTAARPQATPSPDGGGAAG
jgi:hypothetical protein